MEMWQDERTVPGEIGVYMDDERLLAGNFASISLA